MQVTQIEWIVTLGVTIAVLLFDIIFIARRPHEPTFKECAIALSFYVGLAIAFGIPMYLMANTGQPFLIVVLFIIAIGVIHAVLTGIGTVLADGSMVEVATIGREGAMQGVKVGGSISDWPAR